MFPRALIWTFLGAALAVLGLALGAGSQDESFLHPDTRFEDIEAASNLVPLTAFLVGLGFAVAATSLSRRPVRERLLPFVGLLASVHLLAALVQTAFVNVDAVVERGFARLSVNPLVHNAEATPSVLLPLMVVFAGALLVAASSLRRLFAGPTDAAPTPADGLRQQVATTALAAPFLLVATLGTIRLLTGPAGSDPDAALLLALGPLAVLACLGLLVVAVLKTWHLAQAVRNGRLIPVTREAWTGLGRVEGAAAGLLGVVAAASTLLPIALPNDLLLGRTFLISIRGHGQLLLLALVPLVPVWRLHARVLAGLEQQDAPATLAIGGLPPQVAGLIAALSVALVTAALSTFLVGSALLPWILVLAPCTLLALLQRQTAPAAILALLLALTLWGLGNSVVATFDADEGSLAHDTPPGLLALARLAALVPAAWAVALFLRAVAAHPPQRRAIPLTVLGSLCAAAIALVELPLSAWVITNEVREFVGAGSLIASQDRAVAVTLHAASHVAALVVALCTAALHRPEWFKRPPTPEVAPASHVHAAPSEASSGSL
ncbi:MAG: hypothetical protein ACPGQL_08975 [Thermoplasmatota archaeon]